MTTTVDAVYEHGVLRPTQPIELAEGTRVRVIVITEEQNGEAQKSPADILAEIAALYVETHQAPFSGRDHDKILYSESGA